MAECDAEAEVEAEVEAEAEEAVEVRVKGKGMAAGTGDEGPRAQQHTSPCTADPKSHEARLRLSYTSFERRCFRASCGFNTRRTNPRSSRSPLDWRAQRRRRT